MMIRNLADPRRSGEARALDRAAFPQVSECSDGSASGTAGGCCDRSRGGRAHMQRDTSGRTASAAGDAMN